MNYSLTQLSRKLTVYLRKKIYVLQMDLEFPFKPMKKRNIAKVWFFLVAMLGLDFNWLNKTFEQDGKRP